MRLLTTPLAALVAAACVLLALPGAVAEAAFPGTNGLIAFERGADIFTVTTDSAHTVSLARRRRSSDPAWSADGTKLAFTQGGSIRVLTIGGSTSAALDTGTAPAWSPDGTMIAYEKGSDIWVDLVERRYRRATSRTAVSLWTTTIPPGRPTATRSPSPARGGQRGHLDHGRSRPTRRPAGAGTSSS